MNRPTILALVALSAGALLFGVRSQAQQPQVGGPAWLCSGFELRGLNAYADKSEDRSGTISWDIRAVELPPGWQPIGIVQVGTVPNLWACRQGQPRPNWGEHRVVIRP